MNTVKILHCADIHIGAAESFLGAAASQRRYETLLTFERIVDTAKKEGVKLVAVAGDLFDSNSVEAELVSPVLNKISSVPTIQFVLSLGNHDPLSGNSPFKGKKLPENLHVFSVQDECKVFENLNLKVYGKSFENVYMKGADRFSLAPDDDYINLLVLHGDIRSDLGSDYNSITPSFIENSGMDYIALGHIHKRSDILKLGKTYFAYSGCPEGQGFDEVGDKGVYIGEIGKNYCNLKFVKTAKRSHIHEKINITDKVGSQEICAFIINTLKEKYGERFRDNLYKIELVGEISLDESLNLAEILSRISAEVYFAKVKDSTELKLNLAELADEISLKGLFVRNMLAKIDAADESEKATLKSALNIGLRAFNAEVIYNED